MISGCAAAGSIPRKNDALPDKTMKYAFGQMFDSAKAGDTWKLLALPFSAGVEKKRAGARYS